jgi:Holliday junction resolvase
VSNIGLKYEGQVVRELTAQGYTCIRSAASKTIDVVAYSKKHTLFVECKSTRSKTPKSYAFDVRNTLDLCRANGCRDQFYFAIRLRGNKQIWFNINTMTIDKQRTTYDLKKAEAWAARKTKMLKENNLWK